MNARTPRCRYLRRDGNQCTAEAVDWLGEILLCIKHLARAMALIKTQQELSRNR